MKKQIVKILVLASLGSFLSLTQLSCENTPNCNYDQPACAPKREKPSYLSTSALSSTYELIGKSLTAYPRLEPLRNSVTEQQFQFMRQSSDLPSLPILRIVPDRDALERAVTKLIEEKGLQRVYSRDDQQMFFTNGTEVLAVDFSIGRLRLKNKLLSQSGKGVERFGMSEKSSVLQHAQHFFEQLIPQDSLSNTYFYRFNQYLNTDSEADGLQYTYELGVGLNSFANGLAVIGSGGKLGAHLKPDGTVVSAELQFTKYENTDQLVDIISAEEAMRRMRREAEDRDIDFKYYDIARREFGYYFMSKRGPIKWLVPAYIFFLAPHRGIAGTGQVIVILASDDHEAVDAYKENIRIEEIRKRKKLGPVDIVEDRK